MGQPLRITFNDTDYSFELANTEPITRSTLEIPISINNQTVTLVKEERGWQPKETQDLLDSSLLQAIGKAIALRYRL